MNRRWLLGFACLVSSAAWTAKAEDSAALRKIFADPPRQYASAPLWVWNDMLTEDQVRSTLRDLASQKVKQAFVHPRPGLMTPYLSDQWFHLWKVALDEADKLDMNIWIYDENSYPSGFAGGWVPEVMPESRGQGLVFRETQRPGKIGPEVVAVYRVDGEAFSNVTAAAREQELPQGKYLVAAVQRAGNSPWHGDRCYVNLLTPGVTEKFLEVTLEPYKKHIGDQFGKRVLGSFTDEPNIRPAGGLPWSAQLPEVFQKRWGYSLLDHLPSLQRNVGDWKKVRHDYYAILLDQFIEHWGKPYYNWCEKNGIAFTGHYWDHEWPNCGGVPDNMAMAAWEHIPGIDCLMNQYSENTHAQFGNARFVKEVSSLANQLGRQRVLCEIYGAGGWDLRFEDMKRIGDWLEVLGVNLLDEHLSYVTLRGARKADHPQSFSYHEPWWDSYHQVAGYFTRMTAAMTHGEQQNLMLVIEPTTTAWMYQDDPSGRLGQIGKSFFDFLMALERGQWEYDLGCEDVIARHGSVDADGVRKPTAFVVGQRKYWYVVLPPGVESLDSKTMDLLEAFVKGKGRVFCFGPPPAMVDGRPSNRGSDAAKAETWMTCDPVTGEKTTVENLLAPRPASDGKTIASLKTVFYAPLCRTLLSIHRAEGDAGNLFHHRRKLDDGNLLLLVNTSLDAPSRGTIRSLLPGVEQWDLHTGKISPYPIQKKSTTEIAYDLPPCGSLLLFFSKDGPSVSAKPADTAKLLAASGPLEARRLGPNVLTLDYLDVSAGGESLQGAYFHRANQFAFQKNGMPRNPWDSAVQFKDELIRRTFPADSGFEATYHFTIEEKVPQPLAIVVERPDLYSITCNGKPVPASKDWWLDRAFGKLDISALAQVGENRVTLKARPFTIWHEIEPAYVLGDFRLKPAAKGFTIVPDAPLTVESSAVTHDNAVEGTMWLSAGVGYQRDPQKPGNDRAPWLIFDLGSAVDLRQIAIWNYNEVRMTGRGVKRLAIAAAESNQPEAFKELGVFDLAQGAGDKTAAQTLPVSARARYVKFTILANHNGTTYPAKDDAADNAFAGLGEVRFLAAAGAAEPAPLSGVKATASSELTERMHDRRAAHLVDGSGLGRGGLGWNQQGHPFYAQGVAYAQKFQVENPSGRYMVEVPHWYGSVTKVLVNGKLAGHLVSQPWRCDVTAQIQPGENVVEVVVIGTLKNTLGPHHAGAGRGSAWPGMFHQGPQTQPAGAAYDTIGYGLYAPFVLKQL